MHGNMNVKFDKWLFVIDCAVFVYQIHTEKQSFFIFLFICVFYQYF